MGEVFRNQRWAQQDFCLCRVSRGQDAARAAPCSNLLPDGSLASSQTVIACGGLKGDPAQAFGGASN